ncbi:RsmB/NOP family class I SAM-dependent RNA methyltransferase [Pseudactinotalea sp. Z1739]|uniref:RsmB/NOP family class I SAM-dependent RNA methyltransferase n=1 Tax=Pseudactinotalea sp. Z1739 TaxID=3413028 RepID=UPI003C7A816B
MTEEHRGRRGAGRPGSRRGPDGARGGPRRADRRQTSGRPSRGGTSGTPGARTGSRSPRAQASPARVVALEVLTAVAESDAYANLVLPPLLRERGISGRDAAFATELTYGTLRLQGRYDAIIGLVSDRAARDLDPAVARVLRLGAHQILAMRVPDHAAVSESVALARGTIGAGPGNFVNAILRRISEHALEHWLTQLPSPVTDTGLDVDAAAMVHSHPAWVVRAIRAALGPEAGADQVEAALAANNTAPAVSLCLRPGLAVPGDLPADTATPGRWAPTTQMLTSGDPGALAAVRAGTVGVQDEGSQLVTLALADTDLEGTDSTWLDLCAGPGGKSALLGALLAERAPEGVLTANELAPHRAALVADSVRAVRGVLPGLEVRTGDGRDVGTAEPGRYDRVLVDAPCTGLGALRRRPESRWRRTLQDLAALTTLQRELLTSALRAVRPGGVVAYVTCSPHMAETSVVVTDVLRDFPGATLLDAAAALGRVSVTPPDDITGPMAQLWPHRHGTDAMFLALIRR